METVAEAAGYSGSGNCMLASAGGAVPVELPRPRDKDVAETNETPAEQPCKHFSIRRYVALVQKENPNFCSLSQIFYGQQQYDECHSSLYPFPVTKFRPWDCSECLNKAEIPDHRIASRTVSMRQNDKSNGCSISFVGSTLVPSSVDFKSLFPCTQQLSQGKIAERSTLLKSTRESNFKCNSHSGVLGANTDSSMKDLHGLSDNHDVTANTSDNAFVDVTALPEVSKIRANKQENTIAIPDNPKLIEVTVKPNAEQTETHEVLTVDRDTENTKLISGQKGDQACNSGPCEETAPKRSARSNCKKKSGKPTSAVGVLDVKNGRRKQRKVRLLSEIISTDQVAGSRSDIEVDHEDATDLGEDDRRQDDMIPVSQQTVGEMVSTLTKNKAKYKGVDAVDDGSSLMNWMKSIPKKLRTDKKDYEHNDFYSCVPNSKSSLGLSASEDAHDGVLPSIGKMNKKIRASSVNTPQGDENIQDNNLERNVQSTDDMGQLESENYPQRSLSKVKGMSLSKRKMLSTTDAQHDDVIPISHPAVGQVLTKTAKIKTKYKGVDVVDEGSSLMNWMKRVPKKSRTDKKDFDSFAINSKSNLDRVASKDVQSDFVSSVGKLRKRKMLLAINTQQGDEFFQNDNLERNVQNTFDISQKLKTTSLSKRQIPSTANAEDGYVDTENIAGKRVVLMKDDQCHMESSRSVQPYLAKVCPVKCGIRNTSSLVQGLHKKRMKQKEKVMHETQAAIEDIPMDIVEMLARNQHERQSITGIDCSDFSRTQITEDEDCTIIAAEDGLNYASPLPSSISQQKPLASKSSEKVLQDQLASITKVSSTHLLELQMAGHSNCTQEQRTHLCMGEVVTVATSSPLLSHDKDQFTDESPADRSRHERAKKLMWESFKTARRDSSSAPTRGAQFRSTIEAVNVNSTHISGAYSGYPTHQPVIPTKDYYTNRAGNQVQARSFPSTISTMEEAGKLHDRTNDGQTCLYSKETIPATHLRSLVDPSKLAGFPNYEGSYMNHMEFQFCNSYNPHIQYRGSASTPHGRSVNGDLYRGSASTSHGSNLNGNQYIGLASTLHGSNLNGYQYRGLTSTSHGNNMNRNQYRGSASTSRGSNLNEKVPLTLEDLSWHRLQPNLHRELQTLRPLRPRPRVGVLSSLLQKEIANLSDNHGAQSGLRIGVSKGIPSLGINRRENVDALNPGMFSARLTALQLGSVSAGSDYLPARNSTTQSWTRGQEKPDYSLDRLVRKDICVVNQNPSETTVITDDNEYVRNDLI